jgi:hypothetical protein
MNGYMSEKLVGYRGTRVFRASNESTISYKSYFRENFEFIVNYSFKIYVM